MHDGVRSRSFKVRYIFRNITVRSGTSNRNILELAQWLQSSTSWNKVLRRALDGGSDQKDFLQILISFMHLPFWKDDTFCEFVSARSVLFLRSSFFCKYWPSVFFFLFCDSSSPLVCLALETCSSAFLPYNWLNVQGRMLAGGLTSAGESASSLLTATTSPDMGEQISLAALTLSTTPNDSPFATCLPTSGRSTKTTSPNSSCTQITATRIHPIREQTMAMNRILFNKHSIFPFEDADQVVIIAAVLCLFFFQKNLLCMHYT